MARKSQSSSLPVIIIFLGLILMGGALGWMAFTSYQAAQSGRSAAVEPTSPAVDTNIPYADIRRISLQEARAALETGNAVFLDVRGKSYYDQSHIPGALSIPEEELPGRLDELNPADWILTYCT
jgi:3-mercaptopyruvate sulfurtransferase SseA